MAKNLTKKQLEKAIKDADDIIGGGLKWLAEWADYRAALTGNMSALDDGTTPKPPSPPTPPITHFP